MTSPIPEKYIVPITEKEIKTQLTADQFKEAKITNIFSRLYHLYHKNVAAITVTSGSGTTKIYLRKDKLSHPTDQANMFSHKDTIKQIVLSTQKNKSSDENFATISNKILHPLDEKGYQQKTPKPEGLIQLTQPEFKALNQNLTNSTTTDSYTTIMNKIPTDGNYLVSRRDLLDAYEFPEGTINNQAVNDMRTLQKNMRIEFIKNNLILVQCYIDITTFKKKMGNLTGKTDKLIDKTQTDKMFANIDNNPDTKLVNYVYTTYLNSLKKH